MAYNSATPDQEFLLGIFNKVDKDKSGYISADELQKALTNGTWAPFRAKTVQLMIGMFDKEHPGLVSFHDFGALWKYVTDWQLCFRSFDKDGSASIDTLELQTAFATFGYRLSQQTVETIVRRFDRLGQNKILFDDFIQICIVLHTLTSAFKLHDHDQDGVITIHYEQFIDMVFSILM